MRFDCWDFFCGTFDTRYCFFQTKFSQNRVSSYSFDSAVQNELFLCTEWNPYLGECRTSWIDWSGVLQHAMNFATYFHWMVRVTNAYHLLHFFVYVDDNYTMYIIVRMLACIQTTNNIATDIWHCRYINCHQPMVVHFLEVTHASQVPTHVMSTRIWSWISKRRCYATATENHRINKCQSVAWIHVQVFLISQLYIPLFIEQFSAHYSRLFHFAA